MASFDLIRLFCLAFFFYLSETRSGRRDHRVADEVDYTNTQVIRVVPRRVQQLEYLRYLQDVHHDTLKFWSFPTRLGRPVDIQVHQSQAHHLKRELDSFGMIAQTLVGDVGRQMAQDRIRLFSTIGGSHDAFFDKFQSYSKITDFVKKNVGKAPKLAKLMTVGKTAEGRPILCVKLSTSGGFINKTIIYIDGGTHAREWAAVTTTLFIINNLIDDFRNNDPSVKDLLKRFDIFIVPVVNPDGYEWSFTRDRMWRKNRRKNSNSDCVGTDLNRNYPFHWGSEGSSRDPCREDFAGEKALSEPESKAIANFILSNKERMMMYITLHSYGQLFMYPWGISKADSPNAKELQRVAKIGYQALHKVHNTTYTLGTPGQILFRCDTDIDYREVSKLLSHRCLTNISTNLKMCTKNFESRITGDSRLIDGKHDFSEDASKQTECCALWQWKHCLTGYVRSAKDNCDQESDLTSILDFPSHNSSIAAMFIRSYCADYLENDTNCGPFWTEWKIVVTAVFGSIISIFFVFCCADCIRYKVLIENQKKLKKSEKSEKSEKFVTRF